MLLARWETTTGSLSVFWTFKLVSRFVLSSWSMDSPSQRPIRFPPCLAGVRNELRDVGVNQICFERRR